MSSHNDPSVILNKLKHSVLFIFNLLNEFTLLRAVHIKKNCGNIKVNGSTLHGTGTPRKAAMLVSVVMWNS
jgi:hypothetical protein